MVNHEETDVGGALEIARQIRLSLESVVGEIDTANRPVIGDLSYLYTRCLRVHSLLGEFMRVDSNESADEIQQRLFLIQVEVANLRATCADINPVLSRLLGVPVPLE